jgi:hypothetical protein
MSNIAALPIPGLVPICIMTNFLPKECTDIESISQTNYIATDHGLRRAKRDPTLAHGFVD